ncbi:hypothetical protein BD413DRAFT_134186 [Trametes elegans]|nr:hypothetical protein BD413DRAFT_134186 [Trametes elegans]
MFPNAEDTSAYAAQQLADFLAADPMFDPNYSGSFDPNYPTNDSMLTLGDSTGFFPECMDTDDSTMAISSSGNEYVHHLQQEVTESTNVDSWAGVYDPMNPTGDTVSLSIDNTGDLWGLAMRDLYAMPPPGIDLSCIFDLPPEDDAVLSPRPTCAVPKALLEFTGKIAQYSTRGPDDGEGPSLPRTRVPVPLPEDVDLDYCWKIWNDDMDIIGVSLGDVNAHSHALTLEMIRQTVYGSVMPLPSDMFSSTGLFIDIATFPGELTLLPVPVVVPTDSSSGSMTVAEFLTQILIRQRKWNHQLMVLPGEIEPFEQMPVWQAWTRDPRPECIWITAIRRTRPDENGVVAYFPQLELRPMVSDD